MLHRRGIQCAEVIAGVFGLSILIAGCHWQGSDAAIQTAARGRQLYVSLACDRCHGLESVGSQRNYAPTHNHMRATAGQRILASDYTGKATTAAGYIRESIMDPIAYVVPGYEHLRFKMPSFGHLDKRDVDALVQFLMQQQ